MATTVITEHGVFEVDAATDDGALAVRADDLQQISGWSLRPEGLCRGDVCIPVRDRAAIEVGSGVDLIGVLRLVGAPVVVAERESVVAVGVPATRRAEALVARRAPDFELPDLDGVPRRLSQYAGRRRLLVAFATW